MSRAGELADRFKDAHQEFYDFIKNATAEQWRAKGINHPEIKRGDEDEGRPVGLIVHHVATGYVRNRSRCQAWIRGEDPPPPTDDVNRQHAAENPDPDQQATLRFLEEASGETERFIRALSDQQLAAEGTFVTGPSTVEDFVGRILPYHIRWHLGSIRATWEQLEARTTTSSNSPNT